MNWDIRLVNGSAPTEGRLEVFFNEHWYPYCLYGAWDTADVTVVCRELGFSTANVSIQYFGQKAGLVFTLEPWCSGDEVQLLDCFHIDWGFINSSCTHVGIKCGK